MGLSKNQNQLPSSLWLGLFFLSGFAALIYQVAWTRLLLPGLGHEVASVLAVVSAFMAGMGIGSWLVDKITVRSQNSFRSFGLLELIIGGWGLISPFLIMALNNTAIHLMGAHPHPAWQWTIAFLVPLLALAPATICMGATLPVFERAYSLGGRRAVGLVYGANTTGAVLGVLAGAFLLMPQLGLRNTIFLCAFLNLAVGLIAFAKGQGSPADVITPPSTPAPARLYFALAISGLLGISLELAGIRLLNRVLENTIYSFASALAIFLLGLSIGAFAYQKLFKGRTTEAILSYLLFLASSGTLFGVILFHHLHANLLQQLPVWREVSLAALLFLLPCLAMGAIYSLLLQKGKDYEPRLGRLVAVNSISGAFAPLLVNLLLLPLIGLEATLILISFSYFLLLPRLKYLYFAIPSIAALFLFPSSLKLLDLAGGKTLISYSEGALASVAVIGEGPERTLVVNSRFQMGGTGADDAEYRQAHLPLLMHGKPRSALFLGAATGITFGTASLYPGLYADGVELLPEVADAMKHFAPENFYPYESNLVLHVADARRFVRASTNQYDVIVADLFHPFSDGAGSLYTLEHFRAVKSRLAPDSLFCQWLPLYQLTPEVLKTITRTFLEVFPNAEAHLLRYNIDAPVLGLFSRAPTIGIPASGKLAAELRRLALGDELRIRGGLLAQAPQLAKFTEEALLNTDLNSRVLFRAPELVYTPRTPPHQLLFNILDLSTNIQAAPELTNYIQARNTYLQALLIDQSGQQDAALDAYIQSAAISSDFTLGYAHALTYAGLIAREHPERAASILQRLIKAQPNRPVAQQLLNRLQNAE